MILTPERLLALLDTCHGRRSIPHGERHWRQVAQVGWYLAAADSRVDLDSLLLFSVLHDSRRRDDGADLDHGQRAADHFASLLRGAGAGGRGPSPLGRSLTTTQTQDIYTACLYHCGAEPDDGPYTPTMIACFDADRLGLWRVGTIPKPDRLFTDTGRGLRMRLWARNLCRGQWMAAGPHRVDLDPWLMSWSELLSAYGALEERRGEMRRQTNEIPESVRLELAR